ncbi:hypothetical protein BDQ17DRAFT_1194875, partial [Cyathus striatus]
LARPSKGASGTCLWQLYLAQAVLCILYMANLFLSPPDLTKVSPSSGLAKLTSLQCQVALIITGGLRSTPTNALDILAGLLPFHILLAKHQQNTLLCYCTLPPTNPI